MAGSWDREIAANIPKEMSAELGKGGLRSVPTTAGRELVMVRRTEPSRDVKLLVERLGWRLPEQPPPRLRTVAGRVVAEPM